MSTVAKHRVHLTAREHARLRFTNVWRMRIQRHAFHLNVALGTFSLGVFSTLAALLINAMVTR